MNARSSNPILYFYTNNTYKHRLYFGELYADAQPEGGQGPNYSGINCHIFAVMPYCTVPYINCHIFAVIPYHTQTCRTTMC